MFDAIVVGGGLAGCSAAIKLAQRSHRVALIEAGKYPRAKVCGEFLSPESVAIFDQLGFLDCLNGLKPATINTVRITAPGNGEWRGRLPAPALSVSRYALDAALVNHAAAYGVEVFTEMRVTDISGSMQEGFDLRARSPEGLASLNAHSVITAHGKHSNLDRSLNRDQAARGPSYIGLKQHFHGESLPEHIDLHVFHGGYCGISQVEDDRTNVCLLVEEAVFKQVTAGHNHAIDRFIDWMRTDNQALDRWLASATPLYPQWLSIGQVSLATKSPLAGDIFCVGDACGMIAPLAGDGMSMALHSGVIAAQSLHSYLAGQVDAATAKRRYSASWQRTFTMRLRLSRLLQSLILYPSILKPGLRAMRTFPALGDWLITRTRDMRLLEPTI